MGFIFGSEVRVVAHGAAVDTRSCEGVRGRPTRYSSGENRLKNRFSFVSSNGEVL
jgi:hypothetical protein